MSVQIQTSPEENLLIQARKTRNYLWVVFGVFLLTSTIVVASAASQEVYEYMSQRASFLHNPIVKHVLYIGLSFAMALGFSMIPTRRVKELVAPLTLLATIIASIYLFFNPVKLNGEGRWISIGFTTFQPSELFKLSLILLVGLVSISFYKLYGPRRLTPKGRKKHLIYIRLALAYYLAGLFYYMSTSLSVGVICLIFSFLCLFAIKAPYSIMKTMIGIYLGLVLAGLVGVVFFGDALSSVFPRIETWSARLSRSSFGTKKAEIPFDSIFDENRQEKYALIAASKGWRQVFGGVNSSELRHKLPMANSDYVLAIIIEEYGVFGFLLVSGLYISWFVLAGKVMLREKMFGTITKDTADLRFFRRAVAIGVGILIPIQALMNMIVVAGFIVTGQNLPLLSTGGTSLVLNSLAMGLLLGIANEQVKKAEIAAEADQKGISLNLVSEETLESTQETSTIDEVRNESEEDQ